MFLTTAAAAAEPPGNPVPTGDPKARPTPRIPAIRAPARSSASRLTWPCREGLRSPVRRAVPDAACSSPKAGRMRIGARGEVGSALAGVPRVDAARQGGLLDVALIPRSPPKTPSSGAFRAPARRRHAPRARAACFQDRKSRAGARSPRDADLYGSLHYGSRVGSSRRHALRAPGERSTGYACAAQRLDSPW